MDLERVAELLRKLSPRQEKVIRLYFGLGCERPHSAQAMAEEFGVTPPEITGLLAAAQRRLEREGVTASQLREAARKQVERPPSAPTIPQSTSRRSRHWHRRP